MELLSPPAGLTVRGVRDEGELLAARRLHASCYLDADYVEPSGISADGTIEDRWVPYSDYLVAIDDKSGETVGTARLVRPSIQGFPLSQHELFPEAQRIFSHLDPGLCTEISALATSRNGPQNALISGALYRRFGEIAIAERRAYLFAVLDMRLLRFMKRTLKLPFEPIGPTVGFRGQEIVPMAAYTPRALRFYMQEQPNIMEMFGGGLTFSEIAELEIDLRELAPNDIPVVPVTSGQNSLA